MRGTSDEEILWAKEAYECLAYTHGARVCTYTADNRRFTETHLKETVQTCGKQMSYFGVGSHRKNTIVERRIKELILGSWTLPLHATRLWK